MQIDTYNSRNIHTEQMWANEGSFRSIVYGMVLSGVIAEIVVYTILRPAMMQNGCRTTNDFPWITRLLCNNESIIPISFLAGTAIFSFIFEYGKVCVNSYQMRLEFLLLVS